MPTSDTDSTGSSFFFVDSGPVQGSTTYTTVVIYHGMGFTCHSFSKLLPLAAQRDLRLVIVNRRGYPGSTPHTPSELEDLRVGNTAILKGMGLSVAEFLRWFIKEHDIRRISEDHKSGGIVVVGWSLGGTTALALLAHSKFISPKLYSELEPFVKHLILYDTPDSALGYPPPLGNRVVSQGPSFDIDKFLAEFAEYVCGYYSHPELSVRALPGLTQTIKYNTSSITRMSSEERARNIDIPASRTDLAVLGKQMQLGIFLQTERALFDEKLAAEVFPKLEVVYLTCTQTLKACLDGASRTKERRNEVVEQGKAVRPIRFIQIEDANHAVHWDDPDVFMNAIVTAIRM